MDWNYEVNDKTVLILEFNVLWKQRTPNKPPLICHDLNTKGRRLIPPDELFNIYFFIQYIWYQNILLKSWNKEVAIQSRRFSLFII